MTYEWLVFVTGWLGTQQLSGDLLCGYDKVHLFGSKSNLNKNVSGITVGNGDMPAVSESFCLSSIKKPFSNAYTIVFKKNPLFIPAEKFVWPTRTVGIKGVSTSSAVFSSKTKRAE